MRADVDRLEYTKIFSAVFLFCRILIEEHYTFLFKLLSYKLLKIYFQNLLLNRTISGRSGIVNSLFGLPFNGMNFFFLFCMTQVDLIKWVNT